jgi:predicted acetyltransferase
VSELELALPAERYRASYLESDGEFAKLGPSDGKFIATEETFAKMLEGIEGVRTGARIPPGFVQQLELWLVAGDYYVGKVQLRREVVLPRDNVGVAIRPSCRRKGYAHHALRLALPHIRELGIDPVNVVCSAANIPACTLVAHYGGNMVEELAGGAFRFEVQLPAT